MMGALALLVVALPVLALSFATPIYSDEIVWKIIHARYLLDHGLTTNTLPQCGASFLVPTPATHVPLALLDALLYQDLASPLKLRIIGVSEALGVLALFALLARELIRPTPTVLISLLIGFWGIGAMPLLLVLNRPELPLFLGILVLTLAAVRLATPSSRRAEAFRLVFVVAVVDLLLATHPKMLLFLPFFIVAGGLLLHRTAARFIALGGLGVVAYQTQQFAAARGACPSSAWTARQLDAVMLKPDLLLQSPLVFAARALANVRDVGRYAEGLTLAHSHMAEWISATPAIPWLDAAGDRLIYVTMALLGAWILRLSVLALRDLLRSRSLPPRHAVALALVASFLALLAFQTVKNSYDAAFVLGLAGLTIALAFRTDDLTRMPHVCAAALALLLLTTTVSEVRLLWHFAPLATGEWLAGGDFPERSEAWISGFHYAPVRTRVLELAHECGLDPARGRTLLVVDDLTYPALFEATYPIHTMGLTWWGHGIPNQYEFLRSIGSGGGVVRCRSVRPELQARAHRRGDLCCLPALASAGSADDLPRNQPQQQ